MTVELHTFGKLPLGLLFPNKYLPYANLSFSLSKTLQESVGASS
jgi:hypothetical protein